MAICNVYGAATITKKESNHIEWNSRLFTTIEGELKQLRSQGFAIIISGDLNGHLGPQPMPLGRARQPRNDTGTMILNLEHRGKLKIANRFEKNGKCITWQMYNKEKICTAESCLDYTLIDNNIPESDFEFEIMEDGMDSDHYMTKTIINIQMAPNFTFINQQVNSPQVTKEGTEKFKKRIVLLLLLL